ncbi:hypothetical protein TNCT_691261 [Trichonephila clavata]|uniref:Coiled-coil domain-containing protein 167 n=1 Tax=Trichonephila clavata TaxID=2740835 RepID=A0A8X6F1W5_TRICU|nr:hypothetical protein TNCT_691261 [Trichonephila clavata]
MKEIEKKEAVLRLQLHKLELLQSKLDRVVIPEDRCAFEKEINNIKDYLIQIDKDLKVLHRKNRKMFLFALAIFIIVILIILFFKS